MPVCILKDCHCVEKAGHSIHKFPTDPLRRQQWYEELQKRCLVYSKKTKEPALCSCHFTHDQYNNTFEDHNLPVFKKRLKSNAIPDIFPDVIDKSEVEFCRKRILELENELKQCKASELELENKLKQSKASEFKIQIEANNLRIESKKLRDSVNKFLNDNQIEYLLHENTKTFKFSDETIKRSLDLLQKLGKNHYIFVRSHGFPFPSYSLLMQKLRNMTIDSGIQELISYSEENNHLRPQIDDGSNEMTSHTKVKPFACEWPGCDSRFPNNTHLRRHKNVHKAEAEFACYWPQCGKRFKDKGSVKIHLMAHKGEKPFKCKAIGCEMRFVQKKQMNNHFKRKHILK